MNAGNTAFDEVERFFDTLIAKNKWADMLAQNAKINLPIAVKRSFGNTEYVLALKKIEYYPNGATVDVYLRVSTPPDGNTQQHDYLYFTATGIAWSEQGGFVNDEVKLSLLNRLSVPLGQYLNLEIHGCPDGVSDCENARTYASIDCNGLKNIELNADLIFSKEVILPENCVDGNCDNVRTSFNIRIEKWTDVVVDINMPSFVLTQHPDWRFNIESAVFDFSTASNSGITELPVEYMQSYYAGFPETWRGVYFKELRIETPKWFKSTDPSKKFYIEARDMLIDEMGFTGAFTVANIIPQDAVTIAKWGCSLDTLWLAFRTNSLISGGLAGGLQIPTDSIYLDFTGIIGENSHYLFNVNLAEDMYLKLWKVLEMDLEPNSYIKFEKNADEILLQAYFHGRLMLSTSQLENNLMAKYLKIDSLTFQNMLIQNRQPYFSVEHFNYAQPLKIANFNAQINDLGVVPLTDDLYSFHSDLSVSLTSSDDGGYGGKCGFSVISRIKEENGKQKWQYEDFNIDKISINIDQSAFAFNGQLEIFSDNPDYGTGFAGLVDFQLKQMDLQLKLAATFGKMPDFRYWFIDGLCDLGKSGIPLFAGLQLSGFSGGAYQRMKMVSGQNYNSNSVVGVSGSGIKYLPDNNIGLGLKAGVVVAMQGNPDILNGSVELELVFNNHHGLNSIGLKGAVKGLAAIKDGYIGELIQKTDKLGYTSEADLETERLKLAADAPFTATAQIQYDFVNQALTGMLHANIDGGFIKGSGTANLFIDRSKWFVHIGTPSSRFQVSLGYGHASVNAGVYLMAGHDIPAMPAPPSCVTNVLSTNDLSQLEQGRNIHLVEGGKGFCFGSNLGLSTGDLKFLIFYGNLSAALGFDFMLKNYGEIQCQETAEQIGLNGWYASGQAYAYLGGKIGIGIKLFGKELKLDILNLQTAALLQAQLPNPVWFNGKVGANFSVLNGLIKGKCNFKFDIGKKCTIAEDASLDEISIIADVRPYNGENEIDLYAAPQAAFNLKIGTMTLDGKTYKVDLQTLAVLKNNAEIAKTISWNDDNSVFTCTPNEILSPNSDYSFKVEVLPLEKSGNHFVPVKDNNGNEKRETKIITFKTDKELQTIPLQQIKYAYPVVEQKNFYTDEHHQGFIKLKQGHSEVFNDEKYHFFAKISTEGQEAQYLPLNYNNANYELSWTMPALSLSTNYTVSIVKKNAHIAGNNVGISEQNLLNDGENEVNTQSIQLTSTEIRDVEREMLSYNFRTASVRRFSDYVATLDFGQASRNSYVSMNNEGEYYTLPDYSYLTMNTTMSNEFDAHELFGTQYTDYKPLIEAVAVKEDNFYMTTVDENLYSHSNYNGWVNWGNRPMLYPLYAIEAYFSGNTYQFPFLYKLPIQFKNDHNNIKIQLAEKRSMGYDISQFEFVLLWDLPVIPSYSYGVKLKYRLPSGISGSEQVINYNY
ncbi:hypothetical protein FACS1894178_2650 [Bacteroidia bacterium]|nr:hypothetical protein FACS1894178_2650 [Bacteroidia bacterium]